MSHVDLLRHPLHAGHLTVGALKRNKNRPVLFLGDTTMTGGELAERISQYIQAFESLGAGTGATVGLLALNRPDISTQVRFRKEEEILKGEAQLRSQGLLGERDNVKILTSCPACLQGLSRFGDDLQNGLLEADYIVVEMARQILGENWLPDYVRQANQGGIERVLV